MQAENHAPFRGPIEDLQSPGADPEVCDWPDLWLFLLSWNNDTLSPAIRRSSVTEAHGSALQRRNDWTQQQQQPLLLLVLYCFSFISMFLSNIHENGLFVIPHNSLNCFRFLSGCCSSCYSCWCWCCGSCCS